MTALASVHLRITHSRMALSAISSHLIACLSMFFVDPLGAGLMADGASTKTKFFPAKESY
jgi:hypothetical protein